MVPVFLYFFGRYFTPFYIDCSHIRIGDSKESVYNRMEKYRSNNKFLIDEEGGNLSISREGITAAHICIINFSAGKVSEVVKLFD